jgi:hypothetical protein
MPVTICFGLDSVFFNYLNYLCKPIKPAGDRFIDIIGVATESSEAKIPFISFFQGFFAEI